MKTILPSRKKRFSTAEQKEQGLTRLQKIFSLLAGFLLLLPVISGAQVIVSPGTASTMYACGGSFPTGYTALSDMIITEQNNGDFTNQSNVTLILTAPANFEFLPGTGVAAGNGQNVTVNSTTVTATTITINYNSTQTNKTDIVTISNIQVRAITAVSSGNITRTVLSPGTGLIAGIVNGVTNFGTLTSVSQSLPTITSAASANLCNGVVQNYTITSSQPGTTYNWSRPAVAGISNGAVSNQTASTITETLNNTTNAPINVTYNITPTTNGCAGSVFNYVVTVNPTISVNNTSNQVICNGAATSLISFTTPNTGGTMVYNWTNNNTTIGLPASGSGDIASFTAVNTGTSPVSATITVTPVFTNGSTSCSGTSKTFTITVNPTAIVNTVTNQVLCNNSASSLINFGTTASGGTMLYNWTNDNPSIGLAASGSGNIAAFTATNTGVAPVIATITVTPSFTNGSVTCVGTPSSFTITVNPTPITNPISNQVLCNNAPSTAISFTGAVSGTVYNWTNNTTSIGLPASGSGDISSFAAINNGTAPVTATITVTPSYTNAGKTCTGTPVSFTITVNPTAVVTTSNQFACKNGSLAINFASTATGGTVTYDWTNDNTSIGLAASGSGNIPSFTTINTGTAPAVATLVVTPTFTNGSVSCTGTPKIITITVNPSATVNLVSDLVVCNGSPTTAINFSSPTTGGTIVYNWTNNTPSIGIAASGSGNIASFNGVNAGTAPVTATITVTPSYTNGSTCAGTPMTFTITVNPTATVNVVTNQVVCNGANTTAVNFGSPTTGGTIVYNWTNNTPSIGLAASGSGNITSFAAVNTGTSPVVATISVTPSYTNGSVSCNGTVRTFTITVNPTAVVSPVADQVVCKGTSTTAITFSSTATGGTIVYNWTNNTPSIGLAASGTGNIAAFTTTNAGTSPLVATITVTPTYTNGAVSCTGTPMTFTITVNPTATVTPVSNQVVCNGASTTAVNFTSPTTGGTIIYNWTNNTPTIGLAASGSGDISSFTAINNGTAPVTATITVTPSYSNGNTCAGTPTTFTITVNPTATVNAVTNQVVCNGANTAAVTFSSPTTGGTIVYNWTNNTPSIGLAASGSGNIAAFAAVNNGTAPVVATITITPAYTNGSVTCTGTARTYTITVNPTATVTAVSNQVVCAGSPVSAVNFSSPTTGGTIVYNWTNNTPSIGLVASGSGNFASFNGVNAGTAPVTATITVTPSYTNGSTCAGTPITFTITVNPTASVTAVTNKVVCNATPTPAINFSSPTTGGTIVYNWTNNSPSIGLAASGSGDIASFAAVNAGTAPVVATVTVTPSYTNGSVTCVGTPSTFTITVNPTATVTAVSNQTLCKGASTTAIAFSSPTTGGAIVYNWTNNNTAIGLAASGSGTIASFATTNAGTSPLVATITVTPSYTNGSVTCVGTATTFTITVNPGATVTPVTNQVVCNGAPTTAVSFSSPTTGGTIVYNWTNNTPSIGLAASGSGDIASFTAVNAGTAPVVATITVTPSYSNGNTCAGTASTFTITVNPTATVTNVTTSQTVCNNTLTAALTFTGGTSGGTVVYNWTNDNTSIGLAASGSGNIVAFTAVNAGTSPATATITVTPAFTNGSVTCNGTPKIFTITVNPVAAVTTVSNQVVCAGSTVAAINFASPQTGGVVTYAWTNSAASIGLAASGSGNIASFTATNATGAPLVATITVTPTYTNGGKSCVGTPTSFTITVNPTATVTAVTNKVVCNAAPTPAINFSSPTTGGTIVYNWTNNNTSIGLAGSGSGDIASFTAVNAGTSPVVATITVTPSYTNGSVTCTGMPINFTITVNPTATVNSISNQTLCKGASTTAITFGSPTTGGAIVYNWSNNNTAIGLAASGTGATLASFATTNTGTSPLVATITVTPSYTNGSVTCVGTPTSFTITVNPGATVTPVSNQVVCNGSATTAVSFSSPTTGGTIVYNWTNNTPSIGLAASGSGDIASFTAVNAGTAPVVATITVTPSYSNGNTCAGSPSTFTITVNPTATVTNASTSQTVCNNTLTTAITFTGGTSGGTVVYNWTNDNTSIGLAASGSGNIAAFTAVNAGTSPATATITVTAAYTNGSVTCNGTPKIFTITVNPVATVSAVSNQVVCAGSSVAAVNFASPQTGGSITYAWTNSAPGIGLLASGSGNIASFTAANATGAPIVATITVTPTYTNGGKSCVGTATSFTITVNPTATVTAVTNKVVCNAAPTPAINFSSSTTGGTIVYNWTNNNTSIGLVASGTGNIPSFTAINPGTSPVVATITVTPSYTNGSTTCVGTSITFSITVNPTATVNAISDQVVCKGASTTAITFGTSSTGGSIVYNWTNSNTAIGLAASGAGNIASFVTTNAGSSPLVATITVTPSYTNGSVTCVGTPASFTITVNPTPTVNAISNQTVCNNTATSTITFSGAATSFTWTNNTPSIGLAASGTGDIPAFTAINAGTTPVVATIIVTPVTNSGTTCTGATKSFTITVNPSTIAGVVNSSATICSGSNGSLTVTGYVGNIVRWESSIDGGASWTNIANTTATLTYTNLTQTTRYRALVQSGVCADAYATEAVLTVDPPAAGGSISPATFNALCPGANNGTFTVSGFTGNIVEWQQSTNGGGTWTSITNASASQSFTNITTSILYRVLIQRGTCFAYSTTGLASVILAVDPNPVTATPATICVGDSSTLNANTGYGLFPNQIDGTFDNANPPGWQVKVDGVNNNFPAQANNGVTNQWSESNGPKTFFDPAPYQVTYDNNMPGIGGKFAVCTGIINTTLETPVFSTIGVTSAIINFYQAFVLNATSTAKIEISTDGGATYQATPLQSYPPPPTYGNPLNGWQPVSLNLSNYLGQNNLRIRFNFVGTNAATLSSWAIDGFTVPSANPTVTYTWSPPSVGTGTPVVVYPTTTTTYTLVTTVSGCAGGSSTVTVNVNPLPGVTASAAANSVCASPNAQTTSLSYSNALNNPNRYSITWNTTPANSFVAVSNAVLSGGNITINVPANTLPGTYTGNLSVSNGNGCRSTPTTFTITVNPRPTANLVGNTTICQGGSATIAVNVGGSGSFTGTLSGGIPFSGTGPVINVTVSPAATTTYNLASLSNGTCTSLATDMTGSYTVTVNTPAALTGNPNTGGICLGSNASITLPAASGTAPTYLWQVSTNGGGSWSNLSDGAQYSGTTTATLTVINPAITTVDYLYRNVVGNSAPCTSSVNSLDTRVKFKNVWMGFTNTDWQTGSNWSDGNVPSLACADVHILNRTNQPTLSSGTSTINNLIIYPSAYLTLSNQATTTLQVAGTITNNSGTFNALDGKLELNGAGAQTIAGSIFYQRTLNALTLSNQSGVSLGGGAGLDTLYISNHVKFGNVNGKTFNTNDNLTLMSRASGTASVGDLTNNGANTLNIVSGKVCVERYVQATRKWQLLAIPTNTTQSVNQSWQEGGQYPAIPDPKPGYGMTVTSFDPANVVPGGFDHFSQGGHSMKYWTPAINDYTGIANTWAPIATDNGYFAYVRGNRSSTTFNTVTSTTILRTSGTLKQGDKPVNFTLPAGQFRDVGNPYASAIDMRRIGKAGVSDFFYIWDPHLSGAYGLGAYQTYTMDGSGNYVAVPGGGTVPDNFIQSGSAFFVQCSAASSSINFQENDKNPLNTLVNRINGEPEWLRANMMIRNGNNTTTMADGILVDFGTNWSNAVDYDDALKLTNTSENVGSLRDNQLLAIERRQPVTSTDTIYLKVSNVRVQNYQWSLVLSNMDSAGRTAYLEDRYLNNIVPLDLNGATTYNFMIQNVAGSYANDRFRIIFKQQLMGPVPVTITTISANRNNDQSIAVNWNVENETSISQYEVERSGDAVHFDAIASKQPTANNGGRAQYQQVDITPLSTDNYYRIKATSRSGLVQYSAVVRVAPVKQAASISVYPNPVVDKTIHMHFVNKPAGKYIVQLTNKQGQVIYSYTLSLSNSNTTESLHLRPATASGTYQLTITGENGDAVKQQIFIE